MKKFMKAIAFAAVMCMLLSVAAFAAPVATLDTDYQFDVVVATSEAEQVSLLVVKQNASLNSLQNSDILFVGQEASDGEAATFENVIVAAGNDVVDIYAGYASANGPAVSYKGFSVKAAPVLSISLVDTEVIQNVEEWVKTNGNDAAKAIKVPDNDYASVVFADVTFSEAFTAANVVSKIGWEILTSAGSRFAEVDADDYGFNVLDGDVKIGLSFTNGSKDEVRPHLTINGANLYFLVDGTSMQATVANN